MLYVLFFLLFLRCSATCCFSSFDELRELDANGDGVVTSDEFSDACRHTQTSYARAENADNGREDERSALNVTHGDLQNTRSSQISVGSKAAVALAVHPGVVPQAAEGGLAWAHEARRRLRMHDQFSLDDYV